jgi:hypothetical protein
MKWATGVWKLRNAQKTLFEKHEKKETTRRTCILMEDDIKIDLIKKGGRMALHSCGQATSSSERGNETSDSVSGGKVV